MSDAEMPGDVGGSSSEEAFASQRSDSDPGSGSASPTTATSGEDKSALADSSADGTSGKPVQTKSASQTAAAKWKQKALQLRAYVDSTASKLKSAQEKLQQKDLELSRQAKEINTKEDIIRELRGKAEEFLDVSGQQLKEKTAEVERLSKSVERHELASQQFQLRRAKPIQVALRVEDARPNGNTWCLVDYEKPSVKGKGTAGSPAPDDNGSNGNGSGSDATEPSSPTPAANPFISEWERENEIVSRVRQSFGLELALPPVIRSVDILELREKVRNLEDDLQDSKEAYRKYRVRHELAMRQQATELKQARREIEKNFSMKVRQLAETDMEGELKACRRQLAWLEEENQVSQKRLSDARNELEIKNMEVKGLSDQLVEKAMQNERLSDQLHKIQQAQRQQALAGAIAQMSHDKSPSASVGGDGGDDQREARMTKEELLHHFASFKTRAKKIIADKAKQIDAAHSQIARLEHRLASLQQISDRGFDIDVTASPEPQNGSSKNNVELATPAKPPPTSSSGRLSASDELSAQEMLAKVEYLRNLVMKYMSSSDASTRTQMEVTIGSILKFTAADIERLRKSDASPSITRRLFNMFQK